MFSSASRCWVKAVPTHTPKGELLAGWWGGGAGICTFHSTVHGGYVWLPKPGQCCHRPLGMLSPCRDLLRQCRRPRSHQVPLDSGWQAVVLAPPGKSLGFSSAARVTGKPEVHGPGLGCFTCKQITQDRCWLLEKGYHRPSSPRAVLLSSSPVPPGSAGRRGLFLLLGP